MAIAACLLTCLSMRMSRVKVPFPVQCAAKLASLMSQKDHDTNLSTAEVCARVIVAIKHSGC
jgi:hypothetical protein